MRKFAFQAAFAFVPVCAGIFLPEKAFSAGERYVSIVWSLYFGIGHIVVAPLFGSEHLADHLLFSNLALPIISSVALTWFAGWLWAMSNRRGRVVAAAMLLMSCLPVVSIRSLERPPLDQRPAFQRVTGPLMK